MRPASRRRCSRPGSACGPCRRRWRTERELAAERQQLEDAERRGRLAATVPDPETVRCRRYAGATASAWRSSSGSWWCNARSGPGGARAGRDDPGGEAGHGGHPSETISAAWRDLESAGVTRPDEQDRVQAETDRQRRDSAIEAQLAYLKRKLGNSESDASDASRCGRSCSLARLSRSPPSSPSAAPPHFPKLAHTYSIVAWDSGDRRSGRGGGVQVSQRRRHRALGAGRRRRGRDAEPGQHRLRRARPRSDRAGRHRRRGAPHRDADRHDAAGPAGGHGGRTGQRRELHRHDARSTGPAGGWVRRPGAETSPAARAK